MYFSFWSSNERSEGILLLVHLFMFLVVASGFLRRFKDWLYIFDASFLASVGVALVGLRQLVDKDWTALGEVGRASSTIGNAGYVAGFLVFNILFVLSQLNWLSAAKALPSEN